MTSVDVVREGCVSWLPVYVNAEAENKEKQRNLSN